MRIGVASEIESSSTGSSETPSCAATPAGWLCSGNVAMRSLQVLYGILQVLYDVLQRDHTYRGTTPARSRMVACRSTRCTVWLYHLARSCVVITRNLQVLHAVLQVLHAVLQRDHTHRGAEHWPPDEARDSVPAFPMPKLHSLEFAYSDHNRSKNLRSPSETTVEVLNLPLFAAALLGPPLSPGMHAACVLTRVHVRIHR